MNILHLSSAVERVRHMLCVGSGGTYASFFSAERIYTQYNAFTYSTRMVLSEFCGSWSSPVHKQHILYTTHVLTVHTCTCAECTRGKARDNRFSTVSASAMRNAQARDVNDDDNDVGGGRDHGWHEFITKTLTRTKAPILTLCMVYAHVVYGLYVYTYACVDQVLQSKWHNNDLCTSMFDDGPLDSSNATAIWSENNVAILSSANNPKPSGRRPVASLRSSKVIISKWMYNYNPSHHIT